MSEELSIIWLGGLEQFVMGFFESTGMWPDHGDGDSALWSLAIGVGVAFLVFWLLRSSIRIVKNYLRSEGF